MGHRDCIFLLLLPSALHHPQWQSCFRSPEREVAPWCFVMADNLGTRQRLVAGITDQQQLTLFVRVQL